MKANTNAMRSQCLLSAMCAESLMRGPCSLKMICLDLGINERKTERVRKYIDAFRERGLVYISGWSNWKWPLYNWQPEPWAIEDMPSPPKPFYGPKNVRPAKQAIAVVIPQPQVRVATSAFEWGRA